MNASRRARRAASIATMATIAATSIAMAAGTSSPATYPDADGWTFAASTEGWTDGGGSCRILGNITNTVDPLCGVSNTRDSAGFLRTTFRSLVNAQGVFEGSGKWISPDFTIADDPEMSNDREISAATLEYARKLEVGGHIVEKGGYARTDVTLVEGTKRTLLHREDMYSAPAGTDTAGFVRRTRDIGATAVRPGGTYKVEIATFLTTEDGQILQGTVSALYDDVKLVVSPTVDGEDGPTGPTGPVGPDGPEGPTGPTGDQGPAGPQGPEGDQGDKGDKGDQGDKGDPGAKGDKGDPGASGQQGARGPTGPQGPAGPPGQKGGEASVVNSPDARRLLTISRLQPFMTRGRYKGQLRTRVLCRRGADKRCEGVVKIRTLRKINTAFLPGRRLMKRVTLGTGAYRLNIGQIGYAKVFATPLTTKLIGARQPLKVEVLFTALDEEGRQQTLRKVLTLRQKK